jgi:TolA-binding protein
MKSLRLASLIFLTAPFAWCFNKQTDEMQRDIALLQEQLRSVQRTLDEKLAQLALLVQQTQDSTNKTNSSLATVQSSVSDTLAQQVAPLSKVGPKVDEMSDEVRGMRDTMDDLNNRMAKLDAKVTDLNNRLAVTQVPPPGAPSAPTAAPGSAPTGDAGAPQAAAPPPGMTAELAWQTAEKDRLTGNLDLALKEYSDYLTYFPTTDYAPAAQFEIGEISYNKGDYPTALKAFDTLLERFPDNPKTRSAHLMKGQTLLKTGDRDAALQEFKFVNDTYPGTEEARRAGQALRGLGVAVTTTKPSPARRRK